MKTIFVLLVIVAVASAAVHIIPESSHLRVERSPGRVRPDRPGISTADSNAAASSTSQGAGGLGLADATAGGGATGAQTNSESSAQTQAINQGGLVGTSSSSFSSSSSKGKK